MILICYRVTISFNLVCLRSVWHRLRSTAPRAQRHQVQKHPPTFSPSFRLNLPRLKGYEVESRRGLVQSFARFFRVTGEAVEI